MMTKTGALVALFTMTLLGGCPLTDDPNDGPETSGGNANGQDGSAGDGSGQADGSSTDGATGDGSSTDGAAGDGTSADGATGDGTSADGAAGDGSSADGATGDGSSTDGSTGDGSTGDAGADGDTGLDGGATPDAGAGSDAGTPEVDAGAPEVDAGSPVVVPDLGAADMADADRANLIKSLLETEDYSNTWYPFFEETTGQRDLLITPSHGNQVRVFVNGVANKAAKEWRDGGMTQPLVMPNGAVVAKQVYKLDTVTNTYSLTQTVVMAKVDVLDAATYEGDWFYAKVTAAGEASRSTTCVNCHNGRKQTALWPVDPNVPGDLGGREGAIIPYDYLYGAFCYDPNTPECGH